jgi:hypothetical protein
MEERERLRELAMETLARGLSRQRKPRPRCRPRTAPDPGNRSPPGPVPHAHAAACPAWARAAALRQYQQCVTVLQRELGVEPSSRPSGSIKKSSGNERLAADRPPRRGRDREALARAGLDTQLAETRSSVATHFFGTSPRSASTGRSRMGQLVAILGETGIGKSRLVEELIAHAAQGKYRILLGRAYESDQILLFGPFVDAFRADGWSGTRRSWTRWVRSGARSFQRYCPSSPSSLARLGCPNRSTIGALRMHRAAPAAACRPRAAAPRARRSALGRRAEPASWPPGPSRADRANPPCLHRP